MAHLYSEVTLRLHHGNLFAVTVKDVADHESSFHREQRQEPSRFSRAVREEHD